MTFLGAFDYDDEAENVYELDDSDTDEIELDNASTR